MDQLFIKTSDADTKDQLLNEGFQMISDADGMWTFLNDPKRKSARFKNKNLIYSSKLEF